MGGLPSAGALSGSSPIWQECVSSPLTRLILRNAVLALFELKGSTPAPRDVLKLVEDDGYRMDVWRRLLEGAPEIWSEGWDSLRSDGRGPLYSLTQQRTLRRMELAKFWHDEWNSIPERTKSDLADAIRAACV